MVFVGFFCNRAILSNCFTESDLCMRLMCGQARGFQLHIVDNAQRVSFLQSKRFLWIFVFLKPAGYDTDIVVAFEAKTEDPTP